LLLLRGTDYVSVVTSILTIVMSVGSISAPLSAVSRSASSAQNFYAIIDAPKAPRGGLASPDVEATGDIILSHVNFTYVSRPELRVLKDLSLTFAAGKTTAIVGPSGSGKSTIVSLIQRWYELRTGENGENFDFVSQPRPPTPHWLSSCVKCCESSNLQCLL